MKLSPDDTARIRGAIAAIQKALEDANSSPNTQDMRARLNTLRAAALRADAIIADVEETTRTRVIKQHEATA